MRMFHVTFIVGWMMFGPLVWAQTFEVIPSVVDVEAGGASSQVLVRGAGADTIGSFYVMANGQRTSYMLARAAGKSPGVITIILHAREETPRNVAYTLVAGNQSLPLQIQVVNPGEALNTGRSSRPTQDIRETVAQANTSQIVISSDQAPQVLSTNPSPLRVAPDGVPKTVQLLGKRLDTIDDIRVRKASQPPKYRGKKGQLPFKYRQGVLEVELMASRQTALGERYELDLMVGKFKALSVGFEIGEPAPAVVEPTHQIQEGPTVIELPDSASQSQLDE